MRFSTLPFLVMIVACLAACGPAIKTGAPPSKTAHRYQKASPKKVSRSPSPVASSSTPPSSVPSADVMACSTSHLQITVGATFAAAGNVGGYINFTNEGAEPCTLSGWPVVLGVDTSGRVRATDSRTTMFGPYEVSGVPTVVLARGQIGQAVFAGSDVAPTASPCPPSFRSLTIYPPGMDEGATVSAWLPNVDAFLAACAGIEVSEVVAYAQLPHPSGS